MVKQKNKKERRINLTKNWGFLLSAVAISIFYYSFVLRKMFYPYGQKDIIGHNLIIMSLCLLALSLCLFVIHWQLRLKKKTARDQGASLAWIYKWSSAFLLIICLFALAVFIPMQTTAIITQSILLITSIVFLQKTLIEKQ